MKNKDLWQQYADNSQAVSNNTRTLAFGTAAIAWTLKTPAGELTPPVIGALGFTVAYFVCDILQYFLASICLRFWIYSAESEAWRKTGSIDHDYDKPKWIDRPAFVFFLLKVLCLLVACAFLVAAIVSA